MNQSLNHEHHQYIRIAELILCASDDNRDKYDTIDDKLSENSKEFDIHRYARSMFDIKEFMACASWIASVSSTYAIIIVNSCSLFAFICIVFLSIHSFE